MTKVIIAGAGGRMGRRLISLVKDSSFLVLTGAVEGKANPAVGQDAGEVAGCGRVGVGPAAGDRPSAPTRRPRPRSPPSGG